MSDPPLTIGDVLRRSTDHLTAKGAESPRVEAERLLAHALGMERVELYMHLDRPLTDAELEAARGLLARRAAGEPLQYVLGEWGFRRLTLLVEPRALIPRPETETVVERCLALVAECEAPRELDVGTGSGAIALAIADEHPSAHVTAVDVSDEALALAEANVRRTGLSVELLRHDLFRKSAALPTLIVGDFNDWRNTLARGPFAQHAFEPVTGAARQFRSFPAYLPLLALDKAFHRGGVAVRSARLVRTPLARRASDHLPLVIDFHLSGHRGQLSGAAS